MGLPDKSPFSFLPLSFDEEMLKDSPREAKPLSFISQSSSNAVYTTKAMGVKIRHRCQSGLTNVCAGVYTM
jgi:hypothetical protein